MSRDIPGVRWTGHDTASTSPRPPEFRPDPAELAEWTRRNQRARKAYYACGVTSQAHCETCWRPSPVNPCRRCAV